jgi:hypothetical protein
MSMAGGHQTCLFRLTYFSIKELAVDEGVSPLNSPILKSKTTNPARTIPRSGSRDGNTDRR